MAHRVSRSISTALQLCLALGLARLLCELRWGIGPLTLTNVALALLATLRLWALVPLRERRAPAVPAWLLAGAAALCAALLGEAAA